MHVENKSEIYQRLIENRGAISDFGVRRFGLFGSFLNDDHNAESDVDIIVEFELGKKSFDSFMNLSFFLEDILGRKVDLVTPESLSPHIGPKILAEVEYGVID
ncbi:nucleotidyltransferase family protein [soil metagenome]